MNKVMVSDAGKSPDSAAAKSAADDITVRLSSREAGHALWALIVCGLEREMSEDIRAFHRSVTEKFETQPSESIEPAPEGSQLTSEP